MPLTPSYSFSSTQPDTLSSSQYEQNTNSNKEEAVRRVTIRQLLKATPTGDPSLPYQIDGHDIRKVMLVANVLDERQISTGKSYDFDDGTGRIKGNGRGIPDFTFDQFAYATVVGELSQYNGSCTLRVIHVQPIFDPYEIFFHILSAMNETLRLERGPPPAVSIPEDHTNYTNHSIPNCEVDNLSQVLQNTSISAESTKSTPRARRRLLDSKLDRHFVTIVIDSTDDDDDDEGVLIDDIVAELRALHPTIDSRDVSNSIEYLLEEGFIATGRDDYHYKPGARFRSSI